MLTIDAKYNLENPYVKNPKTGKVTKKKRHSTGAKWSKGPEKRKIKAIAKRKKAVPVKRKIKAIAKRKVSAKRKSAY